MDDFNNNILESILKLRKDVKGLKRRLCDLNKSIHFDSKDWLDGQEVCFMLNQSKRSIQTLRDNGRLPFSQPQEGGKIYYKKKDVLEFLESNYNKS